MEAGRICLIYCLLGEMSSAVNKYKVDDFERLLSITFDFKNPVIL